MSAATMHGGAPAGRRFKSVEQVIAASALPAELGSLVRQTAGRCRLSRAERVEVARELCEHLQDGLAAGVPAAELASRFGEPRACAQLLTSARRRLRPLWWQVYHRLMIASAWGLAGLVVLYALMAARFWMGRPTIAVDYLSRLNAGAMAVAPEERAWPIYKRAIEATPVRSTEPDPVRDKLHELATKGDVRAPEAAQAVARVKALAPVLDDVRRAAGMARAARIAGYEIDIDFSKRPGYVAPPPGTPPVDNRVWGVEGTSLLDASLIGVLLPHLTEFRELARYLAVDARLAAADGDGARALASVRAMGGLSRHASEGNNALIGQLVGIAIAELRGALTLRLLDDHPDLWTDAQLTAMAHDLAAWRANPDAGNDMPLIEWERASFYDMLQRLYTDNGAGDGRLVPGSLTAVQALSSLSARREGTGLAGGLAGPAVAQLAAGRRDMQQRYDQLMRAYEAEFALPPWQRLYDRAWLEADRAGPVERSRYFLVQVLMLMPALGRVGSSIEIARTNRDALQVRIACELHKRRHGTYPQRLAELVPGLLPSAPMDPWDGQPLRLITRVEDGRASLVLYSIGADRQDDQGRAAPEGQELTIRVQALKAGAGAPTPLPADWILWSVSKMGAQSGTKTATDSL
jgi:hypothetical protein